MGGRGEGVSKGDEMDGGEWEQGTYLCSRDSELDCPRFGWGGRCRRGFGVQRH